MNMTSPFSRQTSASGPCCSVGPLSPYQELRGACALPTPHPAQSAFGSFFGEPGAALTFVCSPQAPAGGPL